MAETNNQAQDAQYADILERTGIEDGSVDGQNIDLNAPESAESEAKEESKPEETKAEEVKETKAEDKSEEEDEAEDEEPVSSPRPIKSERPLKAVFSQLKELRAELAEFKKSATTSEKSVVSTIDSAVQEIANKRNLDPEGLAEILDAAEQKVMKKLEADGLLKKDLAPDIIEKLKVLDKIQEEQKMKAEQIRDEQEWISILPDLQKQYPNAPANLLADAKKLMLEMAHTKAFHDKELDYVLYKNKEKFDSLLKVAKAKKSGETASKEFSKEDTGEEEDIDLDPENITPEKMKRYQNKKFGIKDDITIMG